MTLVILLTLFLFFKKKLMKALNGPHHYQIANRGGLLVAVPAETLWPDVLRFSTDQGRCWHTIPLRSSNLDSKDGSFDKEFNKNITSFFVDSSLTGDSNYSYPDLTNSWSNLNQDETVVFTGLVTEPGGRAMAAAVYGYGTSSQRWRVAVVDFQVVTNKCK